MFDDACGDEPASLAWRTSATIRSPGLPAASCDGRSAAKICGESSIPAARQRQHPPPDGRAGGCTIASEVNGQRPHISRQSPLTLRLPPLTLGQSARGEERERGEE